MFRALVLPTKEDGGMARSCTGFYIEGVNRKVLTTGFPARIVGLGLRKLGALRFIKQV